MTIQLDKELVNYIESLDYEIKARQNLLQFMVEHNTNIQSQAFQDYHHEYVEFLIKYEAAKEEINKTHVRPLMDGKDNVNWTLNYETGELTF